MINNLAPVFDTEIIRQAHRDYEATGRLPNIIFAEPQESVRYSGDDARSRRCFGN